MKLADTGASQISGKEPVDINRQSVMFATDFGEDNDPRDIDKILNEIAAMVMRFTAFRRFLYGNTEVRNISKIFPF